MSQTNAVQLPHWLEIAQVVAGIGWKVALGAVAVALSPRLWRALRTWQDVQTAQLRAERDIESQRREAVESALNLAADSMATLERESSSLKRQLDGAAAKTERVQLGDPKHATELRAILAELMFTAVALEIVHRASEVGAFFAKPFAKKPSAESDRQVQDAYHLAGMALLLPTLSKGACGYDSQNRLRGCRRRARPGESHR